MERIGRGAVLMLAVGCGLDDSGLGDPAARPADPSMAAPTVAPPSAAPSSPQGSGGAAGGTSDGASAGGKGGGKAHDKDAAKPDK